MSLDSPTKTEKIIAWLKTPKGVKAVIYVILGLVLLGAVLFAADRLSGWYRDRQIKRTRTELNAAVGNLQNAQVNLAKDQALDPVYKQDVADKTKAYLDAINATDAQRAVATQALSNLNAVTNRHNVNISVNDLERKLDEATQ